ncbi:MAG: four helix bundle protein [Clostridia bacterium]|nr:four helix bundle protein [Clostridia bacterium]
MTSVVNEKKDSSLILIPKYEIYVEYMLEIILLQLPRTEKYSIGNEYKTLMYETLRDIMYVDKMEKSKKLLYLNKIDAQLNTQRILLRIMKKMHWINEKKFNYVMNTLIKEIGMILGGLIKYYAKNN